MHGYGIGLIIVVQWNVFEVSFSHLGTAAYEIWVRFLSTSQHGKSVTDFNEIIGSGIPSGFEYKYSGIYPVVDSI